MTSQIELIASRRYGTLSPLRYPGGKASLAGLFADIIADLNLDHPTYIEPYAGGAGAGIALLREGVVDRLVINDIDDAVFSFWESVVRDNSAFIELVENTPLTVDEWRHQREIYRSGDTENRLALGFAFFFLNRTNRSGILNAGVIGGLNQSGTYKIDARFNKKALIEKLQFLGDLRNRIEVTNLDGRTILNRYADDTNSFAYIDPPYVDAGSKLYLNAFDLRDHAALSKILGTPMRLNWVLTYDNSGFIEKLYRDFLQCQLQLTYSARHPGKAWELLVASSQVAPIISGMSNDSKATAAGT